MSKKLRIEHEPVQIVNMDELSVMSDADVHAHAARLYGKLAGVRFDTSIEKEIAYVQRELQIRGERFESHMNYLKTLTENNNENVD